MCSISLNVPELSVVFLFFGSFGGCHRFQMTDAYRRILTSSLTDSTKKHTSVTIPMRTFHTNASPMETDLN